MKKQDAHRNTMNNSSANQPAPCRQSWSAKALKKALLGLVAGAGTTVGVACTQGTPPQGKVAPSPATQPVTTTRPTDLTTQPVVLQGILPAHRLEVTTRPVAIGGSQIPTRLEVTTRPADMTGHPFPIVVADGDTLFSLAKKHYGNGGLWKAIPKCNPGLRPDDIRGGQTLIMPSADQVQRLAGDNNQSDNRPLR